MNIFCRTMAGLLLAAASTAQADPLTTTDFFRDPQFHDIRISPSGKLLAATTPVDGKVNLTVFTNASTEPLQSADRYSMEGKSDIYAFHWVGDDYLVFDTDEHTDTLNRPVLREDLYRLSLNKHKVNPLYNSEYVHFIESGSVDGHVLTSVGGRVQDLDIASGSFSEIGNADLFNVTYFANHKAEVLVAIGIPGADDRSTVIRHRGSPSGNYWKDIVTLSDNDYGQRQIRGLGYSEDDKTFYYTSDDGKNTSGVYSVALDTGDKKLLFQDPDQDIDGLILATDYRTPIGVTVGRGVGRRVYFDDDSPEAKIRNDIADQFPGEQVSVNSYSRDGTRGIAMVYSDRQPRRCYLIDLKANEVRLLFSSEPWIDPKQMSPMQVVHLQARDGLPLEAFLTVPAASSGKKLPLVVLPHGVNSRWQYNSEVQFLAYHGYAVLQVNYRGSEGYGRDFLKAGNKQWGGKIQDDIIDATHWVIDQGVADKDRIGIYGSGFGGYSALQAPIRQPGLFKCAVGYAGVYDLKQFLVTEAHRGMSRYMHQALGEYSGLEDFSPALQASKLTIPVFLAHGKEDTSASFEQYEMMAQALQEAGHPAELMSMPKEGHGFYKLENRVAFYDELLAFLDRNIGPKAPVPTPAETAAVAPGNPGVTAQTTP